jgi:metal-responsive CopG/Arc/MetJ family transcriptional regulator
MRITIELDDKLVEQIDATAKDFNKSRLQYINETLEKSLQNDALKKKRSDAEKVKRFVESYEKHPQQPEEYEIWQDEQVWEDE